MISLGEYQTLSVVRKSDLGYMLGDNDEEVLLHFKQAKEELKIGDNVKVFIYSDKQNRKTATQMDVLATISKEGFATVVDILPNAGAFVSINTPKDVLLSKDYLPYDNLKWPTVGDKVLIRLKDKHGTLMAKPLNRYDIKSIKNDVSYEENETVNGFVSHFAEKGMGVVTNDFKYIFIPYTQMRGQYHLGMEVSVVITKKLDNEYYGTMNQNKELLMVDDAKLLLEYLENHHGVMKLTAKSSAEEVEALLGMSRKAFKRAYGSLYKEHKITFDDEKTMLVNKK
ncbi:MAG: hypothetical protein K6B64_04245 [Acholeplasmatales bacterium]|nr:hypothetical protein [Acholeplasmatales bacterium]